MKRKPEWIRAKLYSANRGMEVEKLLKKLNLNTVCTEAKCPNIGECYNRKTATFMILGQVCTRNCKFCNVTKGETQPIDLSEPENIAKAVKELGLRHVVITSVTRDDLSDNGSSHFANVITHIKKLNKDTIVEVLIPDFNGNVDDLKTVIHAKPDIINHNIETVQRLYSTIRPMAKYERSLQLLENVKKYSDGILSKSGIMVGLSEKEDEVIQVMNDLRLVDCDILTIGQYLAPSLKHYPVYEYIEPKIFEKYKSIGLEKGFKYVASGPLVRSSYFADKAFEDIKNQD